MPGLDALTVWTIGHSSRTSEEFVELLRGADIQLLADIRRFAGSRKHPHFAPQNLQPALAADGIDYLEIPQLGGRRRARADSTNTVWRNAAFRGYADFMQTDEYQAGRLRLIDEAMQRRTAMMCSEAVWWRCHRSMVADDLKSHGARVLHILSRTQITEHPYTSAARIVDGELTYGPE